jgi:predicted nucleic acid-binding protein
MSQMRIWVIKKKDVIKKKFNIHSELIREKLKILPKDKADKARKFAYSLLSLKV